MPSRFDDRVSAPDRPSSVLGGGETDPLTLPSAWTAPPRPPVPIVAAVVPVVGALALWLVTGSVLSLWIALLGPLIAVATIADAARAARRDRRRHDATAARTRSEVARAIATRHDEERRRAWARQPDVRGFVRRDDEIWRAAGRGQALVVGRGAVASALRVSGGDGDEGARALRAAAALLTDAPVTVDAAEGVAVVGGAVLATAVQRALALQLCLALPPGELTVVGPLRGDHAWAEELPHRGRDGTRRLALVGPGEAVPADADIAIVRCDPEAPLPPRCRVVLAVSAPGSARVERDGVVTEVGVEAISAEQADVLVADLATRAEHALGLLPRTAGPVTLSSLADAAPLPRPGSLPAVIGVEGAEPAVVDLVADGPHAVVAGVTGSGKSELLITWILALCRTHTPREITFLLADFKGGTAFDGLSGVPHVTGVLTDLDGAGARRAIESLRAEVRWRESAIAGSGARDILDPRVDLPRLVVVVDEFAALLGDHPELQAVFSDVAARGRALGIHLILGTQRAAGVIRDGLLANCPLRVSLRVTDAADSRFLLGTDDAARLPGGADARGNALVRRAADASPVPIRIALSDRGDVEWATERGEGHRPRRPWLPPLPTLLSVTDLRARADGGDGLLLALADEPEQQRQPPLRVRIGDRGLLVVGGPGSGVTNALEVLAVQAGGNAVRLPSDAEALWDAVTVLSDEPPGRGAVVVIDDLDALAGRFPPDHAQTVLERLEDVVRRTGAGGYLVVAGAHRVSGPAGRLGDLFSRRLLLRFPSRADHVAAGGELGAFDADAPVGRGVIDGLTVQVAQAPECEAEPRHPLLPWQPQGRLTGVVARRSPAVRTALAAWDEGGARVATLEAYAADPALMADGRVVLIGEPDDWQRHWRTLADVRGDHDLVIDSSCGAEFRMLTGSRELPPYCEPGRGRAWLLSSGDDAVRIALPPGGA